MEDIKETTQKLGKSGFIQHVFNFDESTKKYLMNSSQYLLIVLPLALLINKLLEDFVSEFDDSKGNVEILAEVVIQFAVLAFGIFLIHRIVTYFPTYSGVPYENINLFSIIMVLSFALYYSQSMFGLKIKLLGERLGELWNGKDEDKPKKSVSKYMDKNNTTDTQQNNQGLLTPPIPTNNGSRADYLMTHTQMDPSQQTTNNVGQNDPYGSQQGEQFTGIVNEPMAANGVLGSAW
jgi:hypothetical protein